MDPDLGYAHIVFWLLFLICVSGFFSLSEGAIISMSDSKLKKLEADGDKRASRILKLIENPGKFRAIIQTGITFCGICGSSIAVVGFTLPLAIEIRDLGFSANIAFITSLLLIVLLNSFLMLVLGKLLPRSLGVFYPDEISTKVSLLLMIFSYLMVPLVVLSDSATGLILRAFGINPDKEPENVTEEEIRMLVDVGKEKGVIEKSEQDMIINIFEFDDRTVSAVMTHRKEVVGVEVNTPIEEVLSIVKESGHSRIPIYAETIDKIVGILYVKDLLKFISSSEKFTLDEVMRKKIKKVPPYTKCTQLFKEFKAERVQFAVVIEELGGTFGVITMEDLLEAIVGNMQDEFDNEEEEITDKGDGSFIIKGQTAVADVENAMGIQLSADDASWDTISGLLVHELGHIPMENEEVAVIVSGIRFEVTEQTDGEIVKIKATFLNKVEELNGNSENLQG